MTIEFRKNLSPEDIRKFLAAKFAVESESWAQNAENTRRCSCEKCAANSETCVAVAVGLIAIACALKADKAMAFAEMLRAWTDANTANGEEFPEVIN